MTAIETQSPAAPARGAIPPTDGSRARLVEPSGAPLERFTSHDPEDFAVPTGREEEWRFTPQRPLRPLFKEFSPDATVSVASTAPEGTTVRTSDRSHPLFGTVINPADRVSALAMARIPDASVVEIAAHAQPDEPVNILLTGEQGNNLSHVIIDAGAHSKATVVLDHVGSTTLAANVEMVVGDGAQLTVISVQDWDSDAIHVAAHTALIGRDAKFQHIVINLGGALVRLNPTVRFAGPGGEAELLGLSFAGNGQHQESRLYIDHSVPHCKSNVVYRSALEGDTARTVWIGDVRIRPAAIGTSTFELNRNLLLSEGARADSVPNLEIETGEITGAGHASATGRFDDLQLFYLQSRGISEDEARRLVVRGFFADVINRIEVPVLHERLMAAIDARLGWVAHDTVSGVPE